MSNMGDFLRKFFTSRFATSVKSDGTTSNLSVLIDGIGTATDSLDPAQTQLANQFSVSSATGTALDQNGKDWGVTRRAGESDDAYRARILAVIPTYAQGPTLAALKAAVAPFTGVSPIAYQRGQDIVTFPLTFPIKFGGNEPSDNFVIDLYMQNPNGVQYRQQDVIAAVQNAKRSVATVIIWWDGNWSLGTLCGYQTPTSTVVS